MSKPVFWDAAAFLALLNTRDRLHQPAIAISQRLAAEYRRMLTTSAVLIEVANSLSKVNSRALAWQLMSSIQHSIDLGTAGNSIVSVRIRNGVLRIVSASS